ncbi:MAG: tyrosine-type recombinase/integrase [Pyrinomonadaceae bacterium]
MRERKGFTYYAQNEQCWIARTSVTDDQGRRRYLKRRAKSKSDAEAKLKILLRQIDDEGSKVVDFNQLTFNDLANYYEKIYLHEAVYVGGQKVSGFRDVARPRQLLKHFRDFFGRTKLREITYGNLISYRDKRFKTLTQYQRQRTTASWNREAAVLRRIFNVALQQGWILKNPFHCGDPLLIISAERRRERILTLTEEARLLEACDSHPYRKPLKPLLVFLVDTGCRKSEALKLCWRSVCFNSRIVTIEGMTTKTLKTRQVMMTERIYKEFVALWEVSSKDLNRCVFGITDNVRKSFASACQIAGIKHGGVDGLTLHSLRHTAATRLVKGQMPLQMVGRILGHSQPQTTYRYLSADAETTAQAAAILEAFQRQAGEAQATNETELIN